MVSVPGNLNGHPGIPPKSVQRVGTKATPLSHFVSSLSTICTTSRSPFWLKMAPKLQPSARAIARSAALQVRASMSAVLFIASMFEDLKAAAMASIGDLLGELTISGPAVFLDGYSLDDVALATLALQHMAFILCSEGPMATDAAMALEGFFQPVDIDPGRRTHEQLFQAAGMEESFNNCIKSLRDAITMSMHRDQNYDEVMGLATISINNRARLAQSYAINARYIQDVAGHMLDIAHGRWR
jgi:hypothetical protein